MGVRNPLVLNHNLSVLIQAGELGNSSPYAARISLKRLSTYLIAASIAYILTLLGTLLFFRELEINRKLQEHLLRLETERKLYQTYPLPDRALAVATPEKKPSPASATHEGLAEVFAHINDLRAECTQEECAIKLGMVTTQPGTAAGQLLLVLETEVPRIGSSNPATPLRKRYFLYPNTEPRDDLDPNLLAGLQQKAFRFTRALQTGTVFKMGKLLRPIAINAYVFDAEKTLLQHERKVIDETEE